MRLIDIVRKLGILRFGARTGTYTSAKNMPAEFLMSGVYNADKELVTKQDVKQALAAATGNPPGPADADSKCGAALKSNAGPGSSGGAPGGPAEQRQAGRDAKQS